MKRVIGAVAGLAVVTFAYYLSSRAGPHPEGRHASRPALIRAMSGVPLASLFQGLAAHPGRRVVFLYAPAGSCLPKRGLFARAARWIGLDRPVYAQDDNPCQVYAGICTSCPSESKPGGIDLDYGTCNGPCYGNPGYSIPIPDDSSSNGYEYTGRIACNQYMACYVCPLSYCHDCTPGS